MEFQFIYSTNSLTLRYNPNTITPSLVEKVVFIIGRRILLYFQGTVLDMRVISTQDGDGISLSVENIISVGVSPIFVTVPDATQNNLNRLAPVNITQTRNLASLALTSSKIYTINPNGFLTEFVGKVASNVVKDNKAPFSVMEAKPLSKPLRKIPIEEIRTHNNKKDC